ncbi:cytochrome P450 CYP749A22 [Prunus yedoensis var. nudiflora]|uniref:Cytochrome P450 CYP749A22 n=1 Tax=Prunus yedoensis var. nudiflora TaxID=2094558 RepID=A0A314UWR0_PRUYE|nr:cytochrome P450 CYP749A22 [Prunus yedoensis var. nudiflora]
MMPMTSRGFRWTKLLMIARRFTCPDKKLLLLCFLGLSYFWQSIQIGKRKQERRKVEREVRLGKLTLPPNLDSGQDVHLFKPERFSEGVAKATNNNIGAFIPFGLGPRTCVGLNIGTTEAKIALSMILQHYSFTLSSSYVHFPLHYLTVRPQHGVQVMLHSL